MAIWPKPAEFSTGSEVLWLDPAMRATFHCDGREVVVLGHTDGLGEMPVPDLFNGAYQFAQTLLNKVQAIAGKHGFWSSDKVLTEASIAQDAVHETIKSMHKAKFVPWKLHKRHSSFEPGVTSRNHYLSAVQIQQRHCPDTQPFTPSSFFAGDESYEIIIDNETATIQTSSTIGTLWALQTFRQLFFTHSTHSGSYLPNAPLKIVDRPNWRHRGLSVDIARNPFHPSDLTRTIDAMARTKLNRLHIHATDSQSWPLDIPSLPELARKGAYQPHLVWTAADLEEIQIHGASRGVSVFVEIDMPGHTASVAQAYPDLITAYNELDWSTFAAEPLSGQLKLNSSAVSTFVSTLLHDLLPRTSPYTSLYHVGGDEVNRAAYLLDETVASDYRQILQPLLQKFIDQVIGIAIQHGFQPIVWEEMLLDWNLTLPSATTHSRSVSTLVQVWRNSERIEEVLKRGHRAIFGDYHQWYLDCEYITSCLEHL